MVIDRKALQMEMQRVQAVSGKIRFLKKETTTTLRIVEFANGMFHKRIAYHARVGDFSTRPDVCRAECFDGPCIYCMVIKKAQEKGEEVPFTTRTRYLVTAYDINEQGTPQFRAWELPLSVFEAVGALILSDDWADLLDPKTGHAVNIGKSGSGLDTNYTVGPARNPCPVPADLLAKAEDPGESLADPTFEGQCNQLGLDVADFGDGVEEPDSPAVEDEEEKEVPWEKDDKQMEETSDPDFPVCYGDKKFYDPKENECRVCNHLKMCGEKVLGVSKKRSVSAPKKSKPSTKKKTSSTGKPPAKPATSAKDILAGIMGRK